MPPDPELVEAIATELGVDPSFVEKDWHAMRLVSTVVEARHDDIRPVFSGGTSLSKGYGLIRRFSEDLDFKVLLPKTGIDRAARRNYRHAVLDAIRDDDDWTLRDNDVTAGNESRFFRFEVEYPTTFAVPAVARPKLKLEVTLVSPALEPQERSLRSFVAEARHEVPEVPRIACVAPAETAADKLSALTWRILDAGTHRDRTLIRHLHDVVTLEPHAVDHPGFSLLLRQSLEADGQRGTVAPDVAALPPRERLLAALDILRTDPEHEENYGAFVDAMCYGATDETPTFQETLEAAHRLRRLLL